MKLGFFLRESLRALRRNAVPSFAAMATVLVTVMVLGVFIPIVQATTGAANQVRSRVIADVFLKKDVTNLDIERVRHVLLGTPHVKSVQFVSKEEAIRSERKRNPAAYRLIGSTNPLPDTFHVRPDNPDNIDKIRVALSRSTVKKGQKSSIDPAIEDVVNRREDTNKILSATRVVKMTMALLVTLLAVASVLLVANTIRLSLYSRRREVEVMKLVGATDWFIRWPFVFEGILVGAIGGVLAVGLLGVMKVALVDPLSHDFALMAAPQTMNFTWLAVLLLGASVLVSALGSGLSLRRFLRI